MNQIAQATEALPVPVPSLQALNDEDLDNLRKAVRTLERTSLATRLSAAVGAPLDMIGRALPAPVTNIVVRSTEGAMRTALRVALATLPNKDVTSGSIIDFARLDERGPLGRLLESSEARHKAMAAVSGAVGGAFGLATLAVELPVSTTLMLRSIAEIARQEGEDLTTPEGTLACIEVFALGGGQDRLQKSAAESGYFAVRAALAKTMREAARYAAHRSLLDSSAPAFVRVTAQIASRFGIVVSQKVAAQAVPVIGAIGGAAVNAAFMDHFQSLARAHFTVRRLERKYDPESVRAAYRAEKQAMGFS